ncbi:hypothetical protein B0H12DRAFT_1079343 [Mycena haematopus]|nr:hypothetical protein B0H12DRAFT_1079343 [Mycena haematopus]
MTPLVPRVTMGESQILSTHIATSVIRNMLWPSATQIDGIDVPGPADQLASKATVPDRYHVHLFSGLLVAETPSVDIAMKWLKSGLAAGVNFTDFIKSKEKYAMAPGGEYDTDMSMIWNFRIHIIFWPALPVLHPARLTSTSDRQTDGSKPARPVRRPVGKTDGLKP